ncbi:hypothetical protein KJ632_00795 [Patescibacteria group bacterium]|nr:hypothetical protein [Patescibacteria group bacterium]
MDFKLILEKTQKHLAAGEFLGAFCLLEYLGGKVSKKLEEENVPFTKEGFFFSVNSKPMSHVFSHINNKNSQTFKIAKFECFYWASHELKEGYFPEPLIVYKGEDGEYVEIR